jgi:hypothetical protein
VGSYGVWTVRVRRWRARSPGTVVVAVTGWWPLSVRHARVHVGRNLTVSRSIGRSVGSRAAVAALPAADRGPVTPGAS